MENNTNPSENLIEKPIEPASHPINTKKGFPSIILAVLILLLILGGGAYYLGTQNNKHSSEQSQIVSITLTPTPTPEHKISQLVTYKMPSGWKEEKNINTLYHNDYFILTSPNLSKSCCGGPDVPSVGVSIEYMPIEKAQTLEEEYKEIANEPNDQSEQLTGLKKMNLAGLPAISYFLDFEGHTHTYKFWSPKYKYTITIATSFPEDETKNLQDINYILQSLKFTE